MQRNKVNQLPTSGGTLPSDPTWVKLIKARSDAGLRDYRRQRLINLAVYENHVAQEMKFLAEVEREMERRGINAV